MSLDGFGRCSCMRDGKAKPYPFPDRPVFDESGEPTLTGDPPEQEWEAHDQRLGESREPEGYLLSLFLGNITRVGNLRSFLRHLRGTPGPRFPILLEKVLYDSTHTGDWISSEIAEKLLQEVNTVHPSSDILEDSEKEFFNHMKLLCEAGVAAGSPVMF